MRVFHTCVGPSTQTVLASTLYSASAYRLGKQVFLVTKRLRFGACGAQHCQGSNAGVSVPLSEPRTLHPPPCADCLQLSRSQQQRPSRQRGQPKVGTNACFAQHVEAKRPMKYKTVQLRGECIFLLQQKSLPLAQRWVSVHMHASNQEWRRAVPQTACPTWPPRASEARLHSKRLPAQRQRRCHLDMGQQVINISTEREPPTCDDGAPAGCRPWSRRQTRRKARPRTAWLRRRPPRAAAGCCAGSLTRSFRKSLSETEAHFRFCPARPPNRGA